MKTISFTFAILLASLLAGAQEKRADSVANEYVQREVVLYDEDFGEDTVGAFPSRLQVMASDNYDLRTAHTLFRVDKDNEGMYLTIVPGARPELEPYPKYKLLDSFTVEIEVQLPNYNSGISCMLTDESGQRWIYDSVDGRGQFGCGATLQKYGSLASKKVTIAGFDRTQWHRLAISYKKQHTKCYVDDAQVASLGWVGVNATHVFFVPKGPAKIRHIRIASGPEALPVERLLTDKEYNTHAIQFDVNKATFKRTSTAFIARLARFLKKNPSIKLEIAGHTDSDGDAAANMKLSLDRANAVKKQLVALGIAPTRLTTKGLGATYPIDTNATIEGKANNRRVAFIRQ